MNAPMHLNPFIIDGKHIRLFVCEMLDRMILEVLDRFLTDPLTFLFLFPKIEQLI